MSLLPAISLLGATPPGELWRSWSPDPLALAGVTIALGLFFQGFCRLRRRNPVHAPWSRAGLFLAGITVILVGIVSPLDTIAEEYLQSAHMLQHVLIADLGVALTLLAVRGPLAVFFLPRDLLVPLARTRWLRRALARLVRPGVALPLWLLVLVVWHIPRLYEGALRHPAVHRLEHVSFVVVGALVWTLIIDPARHGTLTLGERIGVAAVLFWASQILSYVMVFSFEPFYGLYADQTERLLGLSPLTDQKLAGVVMMVEQTVTIGVAVVLLVRASRRAGVRTGWEPVP
ncbi:MAG: cytochrome c oxidase assembly protein [Gaiellales bacterium]